MFGVGGWGYAVFGELTFLSKLESRGKDTGFSILKPGQHLPKSAITRHSKSQVHDHPYLNSSTGS